MDDISIDKDELAAVLNYFEEAVLTVGMTGDRKLLDDIAGFGDAVFAKAYELMRQHRDGSWN